MKKDRVILHYDMDCFFAAVEIMDNPNLKNKPLVVAGSVVTTASYEARKFGVHSAMKTSDAKALCPNLIVVPVSKNKYGKVAREIQKLVLKITHKVEFISFDEGYVDISEIIGKYPSLEYFGKKFRERIYKLIGLTCSVGIGYNKLTAKIASNIKKPGGQFIFRSPEDFVVFIKNKDIGIIPGVGKKFQELLHENSVHKVEDIYKYSSDKLGQLYGPSRGAFIYNSVRGIDFSAIEYNRATHSIGNETTFSASVNGENEIKREFDRLFDHSYGRLINNNFMCKTVLLKVRFTDMKTITRSKTFDEPSDSYDKLKIALEELLENEKINTPIRLLGVSFGNLVGKGVMQLTL
ncbi:DNA polymerase IV [Fusobacterium sp. PH5-44]|uniref:DNA polymerase IV n=1 Tax=unclassified Fusobacterium TaxID=2648384 RepID=UPI003D20F7B1